MAKEVVKVIKLQIPAGAANPSPPVGPALGQAGVNIMGFCKEFNARTEKEAKGTPLPTVITVYQDKSFTFEIKTPPASFLIKKAARLPTAKKPGSGSKTPGVNTVGRITMAQCKEIAKTKQKDLNAADLDQAAKMIAGTARSMGVDVVD